MKHIGGNTTAVIQQRTTAKNEYGESVQTWNDVQSISGFLDMLSGNADYTYNAKIVESTHVFVCDYYTLLVNAENGRMIINDGVYEIAYIDDPMGLHYQLEIFLKYIGGLQNLQNADQPKLQRVMMYAS